jgi:hypothetical protein
MVISGCDPNGEITPAKNRRRAWKSRGFAVRFLPTDIEEQEQAMNATEIPGAHSAGAFQERKTRTIAGSFVFDAMDAIAVIVLSIVGLVGMGVAVFISRTPISRRLMS